MPLRQIAPASYTAPRVSGLEPHSLQPYEKTLMRPLSIAACLALFLPALALHAPALAADPSAPTVGDAKKGQQLTYTCQGCHGVTGYRNAYPNYRVPRIGGQSKEYLVIALGEYKKGTRKHPTMQAQSESFSDQDIADIAAFLSTLKQK